MENDDFRDFTGKIKDFMIKKKNIINDNKKRRVFTVNKAELVAKIADKAGFTKKDAEVALNAVIASIEEALVADEKVALVGFGTFEVKARAARTGINPLTKAAIKIPATKVPKFNVSKALKDKVAGK